MSHTPKQAEALWCPMVHATSNRCIADRCAMWRWDGAKEPPYRIAAAQGATTERNAGPRPEGDFEFVPAELDGRHWSHVVNAHWIESEESAQKRRLGFCGLAGRPELTP
ncbi:MAG: hypothetical protein AB9M53_00665 [Leptothrix sp. (in: b-proteobacteria)]